jgi:hypothetical protein
MGEISIRVKELLLRICFTGAYFAVGVLLKSFPLISGAMGNFILCYVITAAKMLHYVGKKKKVMNICHMSCDVFRLFDGPEFSFPLYLTLICWFTNTFNQSTMSSEMMMDIDSDGITPAVTGLVRGSHMSYPRIFYHWSSSFATAVVLNLT